MLTEIPAHPGAAWSSRQADPDAGTATGGADVLRATTTLTRAGASADAMSVSPRMASRRRQAHAGRRARRAARENAELMDLLNHELRTPLTSVIGFTELVRGGAAGEVSPVQEELLGRVEEGALVLAGMVEALLKVAISEMAAGGTPGVVEVVRRVMDERAELSEETARATA